MTQDLIGIHTLLVHIQTKKVINRRPDLRSEFGVKMHCLTLEKCSESSC